MIWFTGGNSNWSDTCNYSAMPPEGYQGNGVSAGAWTTEGNEVLLGVLVIMSIYLKLLDQWIECWIGCVEESSRQSASESDLNCEC